MHGKTTIKITEHQSENLQNFRNQSGFSLGFKTEYFFTLCCVCVCMYVYVCFVCVCVWISMRVCCSQSLLQLFVSRLIDNRQERCCIAQPTFSDCAAILQTINTSTQSINKYRTHSNSVSNQRQNNDKIHRSICCPYTRNKEGKKKGRKKEKVGVAEEYRK
jgi:hypothetical protein